MCQVEAKITQRVKRLNPNNITVLKTNIQMLLFGLSEGD